MPCWCGVEDIGVRHFCLLQQGSGFEHCSEWKMDMEHRQECHRGNGCALFDSKISPVAIYFIF